jgi:tetratricopeptide (TPR) repeat protein
MAFALIKYQDLASIKQKPGKTTIILFLTLGLGVLFATSYIGVQRFKGEYHTRKGLVLREQQKWLPMIDEMHHAHSFFYALDPTATPVKWYSGLGYYNMGEMDKAFADLSEAHHANPFHIHVINNLATIYGIRHKDAQAIELYKEAMRISPDFPDAVANLCVMYFNAGNSDTAYQIISANKIVVQHINYEKILTAIIYDIIEKMKTDIDDRDMLVAIDRIRNSNEWMIKVHKQSVHDALPLRKLIIKETTYLMSVIDQSIDSSRADYLRKKYLERFCSLN